LIFGLPDFMVLTLISPIALGVLVASDAKGRGQSNGACIIWFLFTCILWPIALPIYYLVVVEKYRGPYRTSSAIKAGAAFLILLIIITAYSGVALTLSAPSEKQKPSETSSPELLGPPKCYLDPGSENFTIYDLNQSVEIVLSVKNIGGEGYITVEYSTAQRVIAVKEYLIPGNITMYLIFERFPPPWTLEDKWVQAAIIEQHSA